VSLGGALRNDLVSTKTTYWIFYVPVLYLQYITVSKVKNRDFVIKQVFLDSNSFFS
jgi:hypothetical protein